MAETKRETCRWASNILYDDTAPRINGFSRIGGYRTVRNEKIDGSHVQRCTVSHPAQAQEAV